MLNIPVIAFLLLLILELLVWLPFRLPRRLFAAAIACEIGLFASLFIYENTNWYALPLLIVSGYRIFNLFRVVANRRQADHMYAVTRRASFWLVGLQSQTILLAVLNPTLSNEYIFGFTIVTLVGSLILSISTQRNLKKTRPVTVEQSGEQDLLTTISVLIPARNETEDLADCLQSLTQSTYPKLEIIVLDDCSQNQRTPEIIKQFAHDGVRFISGKAGPSPWLAKNYAYQQLSDASSGDLLLFCGVDTRFQPTAIADMVAQLSAKKKSMISFIPANLVPRAFDFTSILVQPSRYAWELALPRRSLARPPVLSTAWLIKRQCLLGAGSFSAVSRSITPERFFAGYATRHEDGYSFLQSDTVSGVASAKSFQDQRSTAVRTRYPLLHQSLEFTILSSLIEFGILVSPFIIVLSALLNQSWLSFGLAMSTVLILTAMYAQIINLTYRKFLWRSLWLLPVAAMYDVFLLHYSMYKYEFSDVQWKGRNVCIPVMRVIDRLPKA